MKQSREIPEIYWELKKHFKINWGKGVIITYGDIVYCKWRIKEPKITHEKVHTRQQKEMGVEKWWDRYIKDREFRLDQELEAYKAEVGWIKNSVKDFVLRDAMITKVVMDLSSDMYGRIVEFDDAKGLLSNL